MTGMKAVVRQHPLLLYFVPAFVISWGRDAGRGRDPGFRRGVTGAKRL